MSERPMHEQELVTAYLQVDRKTEKEIEREILKALNIYSRPERRKSKIDKILGN